MNYLTNYYKNRAEQLQEHYNFLQKQLNRLMEDASALDIDAYINQNYPNASEAEKQILREKIAKSKAKSAEKAKQEFTPEQSKPGDPGYEARLEREKFEAAEKARAEEAVRAAKEKINRQSQQSSQQTSNSSSTQEEPKTSSSTDAGSNWETYEQTKERVRKEANERAKQRAQQEAEEKAKRDADPEFNQWYAEEDRKRADKAQEWHEQQAAAERNRSAKGQSSTSSTETPKTTPPVGGFQSFTNKIFPTFKQGLGATTKAVGSEVAGSVKHLFTPAGLGGLGAAYATDVALDKAADITGQQALKNPWIKTPASWAAGQAVDTAIGQGVRALGTRAGLAAVGGSALQGAAVGAAAYGGYKAGEAIANAEHPFQEEGKHETVADAFGKGIYYVARSPFNWIAGNKTGAGTSDLNEKPTGVAGRDPTINATNAAEDEEEDRKNKERAAWIAQRAKELQGQSENN
jgi:chemotaxis protein histidine kinase CheA